MTKTASSPALKLGGPTGLVAAVPSLLGFHPQESLVVLCIRPPGLVGPVVRADLDGSGQPPPAAMAAQLASFAIRYGQTAAVICYTEQGGRPPLLDETIAALDRGDMPIFVVLTVRDGVIRHSWTAEIEAADHGLPEPPDDDPQAQAMAVLNVGSGRGVLRNRDALRASIAAPVGDTLTEARAAILGFCEELSSLPADVPQIEATMVARGSRAMTRARRELRQAGRVATGTAAELIVLTNSVAVRDAVIARAVTQYDTDWVATFISVVTRCPPEEAAEICSGARGGRIPLRRRSAEPGGHRSMPGRRAETPPRTSVAVRNRRRPPSGGTCGAGRSRPGGRAPTASGARAPRRGLTPRRLSIAG